ncbi:hypothetical protein J8273_0718 [Carpediemonas membranifera]|uniref:Uncharacterized protein n=1 Tax=Carpediemonas membranifera TaxID=201153 RepID=A0A8J6AZ54_9EUKA|nr:hypothetical protein J8273_0718 [Carpediemonas membranifera]|eukprot:KAG9397588.1 hypothetical protein J8273_0718 [Carpediemonas membranifera]
MAEFGDALGWNITENGYNQESMDFQALSTECETLREALRKLQGDYRHNLTLFRERDDELDRLERANKKQNTTIVDLEATLEEFRHTLQKSITDYARLESEVDNLELQKDGVQRQLAEAANKNMDLTAQIADLKKALDGEKSSQKAMESAYESKLNAVHDEMQRMMREKEAINKVAEQQRTRAEAAEKDLAEAHTKSAKAEGSASQRVAELEAGIQRLQEELHRTKEEAGRVVLALERRNDDLINTNAELRHLMKVGSPTVGGGQGVGIGYGGADQVSQGVVHSAKHSRRRSRPQYPPQHAQTHYRPAPPSTADSDTALTDDASESEFSSALGHFKSPPRALGPPAWSSTGSVTGMSWNHVSRELERSPQDGVWRTRPTHATQSHGTTGLSRSTETSSILSDQSSVSHSYVSSTGSDYRERGGLAEFVRAQVFAGR